MTAKEPLIRPRTSLTAAFQGKKATNAHVTEPKLQTMLNSYSPEFTSTPRHSCCPLLYRNLQVYYRGSCATTLFMKGPVNGDSGNSEVYGFNHLARMLHCYGGLVYLIILMST